MVRVIRFLIGRNHVVAIGLFLLLTNEVRAGGVQDVGRYDAGNAPIVNIVARGLSAGHERQTDQLRGVAFVDTVHPPQTDLNHDLAMDPVSAPANMASASIGALSLVILVWLRRARAFA